MDLYIYYRVPAAHTAALAQRLSSMQQTLFEEYGIVGSIKRRPVETDGCQTWMEIYQAVPPDFNVALDRAVMLAGLIDLIEGPRNTEIFVDV